MVRRISLVVNSVMRKSIFMNALKEISSTIRIHMENSIRLLGYGVYIPI